MSHTHLWQDVFLAGLTVDFLRFGLLVAVFQYSSLIYIYIYIIEKQKKVGFFFGILRVVPYNRNRWIKLDNNKSKENEETKRKYTRTHTENKM